jgi:hypothetical protein
VVDVDLSERAQWPGASGRDVAGVLFIVHSIPL